MIQKYFWRHFVGFARHALDLVRHLAKHFRMEVRLDTVRAVNGFVETLFCLHWEQRQPEVIEADLAGSGRLFSSDLASFPARFRNFPATFFQISLCLMRQQQPSLRVVRIVQRTFPIWVQRWIGSCLFCGERSRPRPRSATSSCCSWFQYFRPLRNFTSVYSVQQLVIGH